MPRRRPRSTLFPYTTRFRSHVRDGRGNRAAIVWEGEPGETRVLTYRELLREVRLFASVLRGLGVTAGDRVGRSEEHTSELQSRRDLVCRLLLEKKKRDAQHG